MDDQSKVAPGAAPAGAPEPAGAPRDLSFLWPVIDRIRAVEIKFEGDGAGRAPGAPAAAAPKADVEARLRALESDVAAIKKTLQDAIGTLARGVSDAAAAFTEVLELPPQSWPRVVLGVVAATLLLLGAHYVIVYVYDLHTVALRLISIAIPLPIAIALTLRYRIQPWFEVAVAALIGFAGVFGMAYVTSVHEKTTFLPENMREWRETLEYVASITLAYLTGVLISGALQARTGASNRAGRATLKLAQAVASITGKAIATGPQLKKHVDQIQGLINALMPAASAVAAVAAGLKSVLG